jgi:hypothetical protein
MSATVKDIAHALPRLSTPSLEQMLALSDTSENFEAKRRRRWKHARRLYALIRANPQLRASPLRALWSLIPRRMTRNEFVVKMVYELQHVHAHLEVRLRQFYDTFEGTVRSTD